MAANHLNNHHRDTLAEIFSHPSSGNIEWRQVVSLAEAIGTVTEEHNGKFKVSIGDTTMTLDRPRGKDIDQQLIVDLRHALAEAGYEPTSE